jgi:hypothetical protein
LCMVSFASTDGAERVSGRLRRGRDGGGDAPRELPGRLDHRAGSSLRLHLPLIRQALHLVLIHRRVLKLVHGALEHMSIRGQPRVRHDRHERRAVRGVWDEHHREQVPRVRGDVVWERERRVHDVFVQQVYVVPIGIGGVVVEGEIPREHRVQNDAARPDVHRGPDVQSFGDDELRRGVARGSA